MNYKIIILLMLLLASSVYSINISSCAELQAIDTNNTTRAASYTLTQDISCNVAPYNTGSGFDPIGDNTSNFTGTFDGSGYKITGLFINRSSTNYVGLFGVTSSASTVQNVTLEEVNITGASYTGGVAGLASGTITNLTVKGSSVTGTSYTGGIIGSYAKAASLNNFYSEITSVTGTTYVGGVMGNCRGDVTTGIFDINNASSRIGTLTARGENVGGVCGWAGNGHTGFAAVNRCSTTITNMIDSNASSVGGIVGGSSWKVSIRDSNSDINYIKVSGSSSYDLMNIGGLAGIIDGNISNSFSNVNLIDVNKNFGTQVKVGGLAGYIGNTTGNGYIFNSWSNVNINASIGNVSGNYVGGLAGFTNGGIIGSYTRGTYIRATKTSVSFVGGLAGRLEGVLVDSNSIFTDINGGTGERVGGLVGSSYQSSSRLYNYSKNNFAIIDTIAGGSFVGGLVGEFVGYSTGQFDFNNSYSVVRLIRSSGSYVGGLLGYVHNASNTLLFKIFDCNSTITDRIEVNSSTASNVGGLIGSTYYAQNLISNSWADVNYIRVNGGDVSSIGGLVGVIDGNISNCFARVGNIDVNKNSGTQVKIGGLVGFAGQTAGHGYIFNSWADSNINASIGTHTGDYIGGLAGFASGGIIGSYSRGSYIRANKLERDFIGGLVGRSQGYLIDSNSIFNDINGGAGSSVGGLVGSCYQGGATGYNYTKNLFATVNTLTGGSSVGGLMGQFTGYNPTRVDFNDSSSTVGSLYASGGYVGGLLGYAKGYNNILISINNCSSTVTGKIESIGSSVSKIGGLVGGIDDSLSVNIQNSFVDINQLYVYATTSGSYHVGGLIGYTQGSVSNSYSMIDNMDLQVTGRVGGVGGTIIGNILNSWADVNINNSIGTFGAANIGGIVGLKSGDVNNCYSKGNFIIANKSGSNEIGGLVGWSTAGTINNSYSSIETITAGTNTKVGGLIGNGSTIRNSFSITAVTAGSSSGPFCGTGCSSITNSYFLSGNDVNLYGGSRVSTVGSTYFKDTNSVVPLTSWSFYNVDTNPGGVWFIWSGDYPHLSASPIVTYYSSGTFISKAIDLGDAKKFTTIDLNMLKPTGTTIDVQIRTATTQGGLASAPWMGPDGTSDSNYSLSTSDINSIHDGNSWVQYKAILSTSNNLVTPVLYDVNIHTIALGEAIYSKTGTAFTWISFGIPSDTNGCTLSWFYSLSNSPYNWVSTSGELSGSQDLWLRVLINGTIDSNNLQIGNFNLTYSE